MTMQQELEKMTQAPGVVAVYGRQGGDDVVLFGTLGLPLSEAERQRWNDLFVGTRQMLATVEGHGSFVSAKGDPCDEVRLVLGDQTLVMRRQDDVHLAVAFRKGAAVVKSLPRMIRRTFKRLGKAPAPPPSRTFSTPRPFFDE